ncbi:TPA: hypothetical protein UMY79_003698 [Stenotrophomonas maltophilia]|nr:hypothetical protein [Stenotrophomonas maltophilia]
MTVAAVASGSMEESAATSRSWMAMWAGNRAHSGTLLLVLLSACASAPAFACTGQHNRGADIHLTIDGWDDVEQDKVISSWLWAGNAGFLTGCTAGELIPFDLTSALPELEFIRYVSIDGDSYPAYGLRSYPRSPLLVFRHWAGSNLGTSIATPVDVTTLTVTRTDAYRGDTRSSHVQIAAVSRGGIMERVPATLLGPITRVSPRYPQFVKTDTFTVTANLKVPTCKLSNTPVTLQDVNVADLPASGRIAGERSFDVAMNCNGAFPVEMVLTDANLPGNTGSRLAPTANSTAGAARVELLREGTPVVLGKTWTIPLTQNGPQNITLAARYYREAGTFHGGVVEGQAVITATYR